MNPTDEDLVLYADGALDPERKALLLDAAKNDSELEEILLALDNSQLPFKAAIEQQFVLPIPDDLRLKVWNMSERVAEQPVELPQSGQYRKERLIRFSQAASMLIFLGVGYVGGIHMPGGTVKPAGSEMTSASNDDFQAQWVERVVDYQSLYVSNTVGGIEVDMQASVERLNQMAAIHEMDVAIPDLSAQGYEFARVQELGFNGKPLIQLVYTKDGDTPLALCFMPADGDTDQALNIASHHGLGAADWILGDQRFVLVAEEPTEVLQEIHASVISNFPDA